MKQVKVYMNVQLFDQPKVLGTKKKTYVGRVAKQSYWSREKMAMVSSPFVSLFNEAGEKVGDVIVDFDLVFQPKAVAATVEAVEA